MPFKITFYKGINQFNFRAKIDTYLLEKSRIVF